MLVSRALHEIADRLDESSRVAHQPTLADTRTGYYPDTDTEYVDVFINFFPLQTSIPPDPPPAHTINGTQGVDTGRGIAILTIWRLNRTAAM